MEKAKGDLQGERRGERDGIHLGPGVNMAENLSHRSLEPRFQAKDGGAEQKPKPEAKGVQVGHQDWGKCMGEEEERREVGEGE